ncbi:MAG: hypothetical protein EP343_09445 [Deltaproteobacteria bacterium]|nr:MAG: hypothetical protein EP343_09445 [Deltaproteobacteria bacterium]
MKHLYLIVLLCVGCLSCGVPEPVSTQATLEPAKPEVTRRRSRFKLLPKAMTPEERRLAKELIKQQPQTIASYATTPSGKVRVPAEFEPMEGVLVRVANDEEFDEFFGNMIKGIIDANVTPYLVYYNDQDKNEVLQYSLAPKGISSSQVKWVQSNFDAFWARDYGPWHIYVDGKRAMVDMKYYPTRTYDDFIPFKLATDWSEDVYSAHLYVEGGNFMTDGKGTCWTSTGIFESNNLSPIQLASLYKKFLGCQKTYFPPPLYMEGTTHIDMFSKLINETTILVGYSKPEWGANSNEIQSLDEIARFYEGNTNVKGQPFKVVRIPMGFTTTSGERVYFAYSNSTILNKAVLVPLYGQTIDNDALKVYQDNMPGYNVVGIKSGQTIIPYGGSVHCTTMQIPKATDSISESSFPKVTSETKTETLEPGAWKMYGPYTAGAGDFKVTMAGDGDADLYVWKDVKKDQLTSSNFACSPYLEDSYEECKEQGPGSFYVGVYNVSSESSSIKLTIDYIP